MTAQRPGEVFLDTEIVCDLAGGRIRIRTELQAEVVEGEIRELSQARELEVSGGVEQELNAWVNWFSVMGLQNPAPALRVSLELRRSTRKAEPPLPQLDRPGMVVKEGEVLVPVVRNDSEQPLYITLVGLSSDRSVGVAFPAGADADTPFRLKAHSGEYSLPAIQASVPGCLGSSRDVLILLASTQSIPFSAYSQDGFCPAEHRTFSQVNLGRQGWTNPPGSWTTVRELVEIQK